MTPPATPAPTGPPSPRAEAPSSGGRATTPPRRRRPASRLERGVLSSADAQEGLAWLGRPPEARASLLYRAVRLFARFVLFGLCRMKVDTSGQEHLPNGGYLLIGAAHRGWMDPFLVMHAVPVQPRVWFLGSGPSAFTSRLRERFIHRLGGLLPVWRGGVGIDSHLAAARAVIANGGVFAQMPEGTVSGRPGRIGPFRAGAALIALRTGAPIVLGPAVAALYPRTVDPPTHPRRLRKRLTWLLLRPGRLDRVDGPTDGV